jgi:hypothetical protein
MLFSIFPFCTFDAKRILLIQVYSVCTETEHCEVTVVSQLLIREVPVLNFDRELTFSLDIISFSRYVSKKYIKLARLAFAITYIHFDFHFTFSVTLVVGTTSLSNLRIVIIDRRLWSQMGGE